VELDGAAWQQWLVEGEGGAFRFQGAAGAFTARRERQRNGWYWYAYRRVAGRLCKAYLGRAQDLSLARLELVAAQLGAAGDAPVTSHLPSAGGILEGSAVRAAGLLATKLHPPPVRHGLVPRPHLARRLAGGLSSPLTTVVAPAGFGKTTLVAGWIALHPSAFSLHPSVFSWLSLDQGDNDPARFWTYVAAALDVALPGVASAAFPLLQSPQLPVTAALPHLLNALASARSQIALVLDDYHVIEAQAVRETVAFAVEHLPPNVHLFILSRVDPPLPLARLRARGQLHEIRAADLRFSAGEAEQFFSGAMGLALAPEAVAALEERTEGWAAGLQLAALAMRDRADPARFIESFAGSHRSVADYLAEEVIERQPEQVQRFLLHTSLLDRMCAELCDSMLQDLHGRRSKRGGRRPPRKELFKSFRRGFAPPNLPMGVWGQRHREQNQNAQQMLEYLDRANLFLVPLDDERRWYRYHHLFGEMLRDRLLRREPELARQLHRRAAVWHRSAGLSNEAVRHALAAGDYELAADMIEECAASVTWILNELHTLLGWLAAFPDDILRDRPRLLMARAWTLLMQVRAPAVEQILRRIEASEELEREVRGPVAAARSFLFRLAGDIPAAVAAAHHALEELPEDDINLRSLVAGNLENAYMMLGDVRRAERALSTLEVTDVPAHGFHRLNVLLGRSWMHKARGRLRDAYALVEQALQTQLDGGRPELPSNGLIYIALAEIEYEWNDLDSAERHARIALGLGDRWWNNDLLINAYGVLGPVLFARGDPEAEHLFNEIERLSREYDSAWITRQVECSRARLALLVGRLDQALRWVETCGLAHPEDPELVHGAEYAVLARAMVAQGQAEAALALLRRLIRQAEEGEYTERLIELHKVRALAHEALGDDEAAREALGWALALAQPGGFIRIFADEGPAMARLIRAFCERGGDAQAEALKSYARRILAAFVPSSPAAPSQPELLTRRERDVLRLLAAGWGNKQIAYQLRVEVSTVRSHVKSIYAKLDAAGRVQAVVRARDLGLL
jgi:LuxR family maltose regulon positive regulatory protein